MRGKRRRFERRARHLELDAPRRADDGPAVLRPSHGREKCFAAEVMEATIFRTDGEKDRPRVAVRQIHEIGVAGCLAKWGTPDQVPLLVARLDQPNANRAELLNIVRSISPDDGLREAVRLLPADIGAAEHTLLQLGAKAEAALLSQANHEQPEVRQAVARILLTIGTPQCLPALVVLSQDPNPDVSQTAKQALEVVKQRMKM